MRNTVENVWTVGNRYKLTCLLHLLNITKLRMTVKAKKSVVMASHQVKAYLVLVLKPMGLLRLLRMVIKTECPDGESWK